jgi:hypothetical protein
MYVVMCYGIDGRNSMPDENRLFFSTQQHQFLELAQPPIQCVMEALTVLLKRPNREAEEFLGYTSIVLN